MKKHDQNRLFLLFMEFIFVSRFIFRLGVLGTFDFFDPYYFLSSKLKQSSLSSSSVCYKRVAVLLMGNKHIPVIYQHLIEQTLSQNKEPVISIGCRASDVITSHQSVQNVKD